MTADRFDHSVSPSSESNSKTPPGLILGRKGNLEVRVSNGPSEVAAAQALRYRTFYAERGIDADPAIHAIQRDVDAFDEICDHLLVLAPLSDAGNDPIVVDGGEVVGTYRLLRQDVAEHSLGFYSQNEFDLAPLLARKPDLRFLELGRSCVLKPYRTRPVVELLWQGIWNYVRLHGLDVMFGCASLDGTDLEVLQRPLQFLREHFRAPAEWAVSAHSDRGYFAVDTEEAPLDERQVLRMLPPLIKGYLRLGAYIGDGAYVDHQFNTVDVLIILPVASINSRYFDYFGQPGDTPAI